MTTAALRDARDEIKAELEELDGEEAQALEEIRELEARLAAIRERRSWRREQLTFVRGELKAIKTGA